MKEAEAWKIDWYECRADRDDVDAGTAKKVGDVLWRLPISIGPVRIDHDHWARYHLGIEPEVAIQVSLVPKLIDALGRLLMAGADDPGAVPYASKVYYDATHPPKA